jgi:hypothetical protein
MCKPTSPNHNNVGVVGVVGRLNWVFSVSLQEIYLRRAIYYCCSNRGKQPEKSKLSQAFSKSNKNMGRLPPPPASLKPLQVFTWRVLHANEVILTYLTGLQMFLKTADEFDRREQSISYFCALGWFFFWASRLSHSG